MANNKEYRNLDEWDGSYFIGTSRGTTMNAKIMNTNATQFETLLKPGFIYDITRFSTSVARNWDRPSKHPRVMWLNANTKVELIGEVAGFPIRREPSYVKLDEAAHIVQRNDNTYLLVVIGVVVSVSTVNAYSTEKLKRVVGIEDDTGTKLNIVLWNEHAADFEQLEIVEKSVLALSSVAVNHFKGFESESLTTGKFTQIFLDSETPAAKELKKSDGYSELEEGLILADWREMNRNTLANIVSEFDPNNTKHPYTCMAEIVGHTGIAQYLACKNCNTKCPEASTSFYCKKCKLQTPTHTYCRMEASTSDKTSTEVVTLFGKIRSRFVMRNESLKNFRSLRFL